MQCKKLAIKQQANSNLTSDVYQVCDSVQFDKDHITDVPESVAVHSWLDHTVTMTDDNVRQ